MKGVFIMKKIFLRFYKVLNILSVFIDLGIAIYFTKLDDKVYQICGFIYLIFTLWKFGKAVFLVLRSKREAKEYLEDNRILPIEGKQRVGKTSLSCYFIKVLNNDTYSNVPLKIKGNFTNKITTEILSLEKKIEENAIIYIDECNLYYNNLRNGKSTENNNIFGQSIFAQCVGHFTDGNIIYSSTYTDKLPKEIRVNFSCKCQVLKQQTYNFALIGSIVLKLIARLFGIKDIYTGLRHWTVQHFEKIHAFGNDDGESNGEYKVDLNNPNGKFAPIYEFYDFQGADYEYNDRYMKGLYDILDNAIKLKHNNLNIDISDNSLLYDAEVFKYMTEVYEKQKKL